MQLPPKLIQKIEGLLESGVTVEVTQASAGTITIHKRPSRGEDIPLTPTLVCSDFPTTLEMRVLKAGEDPIFLSNVPIPPGYYIAGIKGFRRPEGKEDG